MNHDHQTGSGLTRSQRRILLWLPIMGFWAVLFLVSKRPEGGRDWHSFLMMGIAGTAALVGVWFALGRMTGAKKPQPEADEETAPKSRAQLIYGAPTPVKTEDEPEPSEEDDE